MALPAQWPVIKKVAPMASEKEYLFLLVDDNIINLRILSRILMRLFPKASVVSVQDLSLLTLTSDVLCKYHCIFLDIEMPHVTGLDIASFVRQNSCLDNVGLVAVTTRALMQDLVLYDSLGFDHCFEKPVPHSDVFVLRRIEHIVEERAALALKRAEKLPEKLKANI